jgi:hypothetical protein
MTLPVPFIMLNVARPVNFPDCTNGGISGKYHMVTLVGITHDAGKTVELLPRDQNFQTFAPIQPKDEPFVVIEVRQIGGPILTLRPAVYDAATGKFVATAPPGKAGPMDGGNYADTSDSRFRTLTRNLYGHSFYGAMPIHDRFE